MTPKAKRNLGFKEERKGETESEDAPGSSVPAVYFTGAELAELLQQDVTLTAAHVSHQREMRARANGGSQSASTKRVEKEQLLLAKLDEFIKLGTYSVEKRKPQRKEWAEDHDLWETDDPAERCTEAARVPRGRLVVETLSERVFSAGELSVLRGEVLEVLGKVGRNDLHRDPFAGKVLLYLAQLLVSRNAQMREQAARLLVDIGGRCSVERCAEKVEGFEKAAAAALETLTENGQLSVGARMVQWRLCFGQINSLFGLGLSLWGKRAT